MWRVSSTLSLNGLSTPFKFSPEAAERGTAVHAFVEHHAHGEAAPMLFDEVAVRSAPYVLAARKWFADLLPTVLFTERRVASITKRSTGRIDLGVIVRNEIVIVDVKSGGHAPWHGIQVCGYCDLADADPELSEILRREAKRIGVSQDRWKRGILYLHDNGTYRWHGPLDLLKSGPNDAYLWRAAQALVCWKYDNGYLQVIDSQNPEE